MSSQASFPTTGDPSYSSSSYESHSYENYTDHLGSLKGPGNGSLEGGPQKIEFSFEFQVLIYMLYNIVFVWAVVGNVLVCYVVFSSVRMRTVTNYLIANLAIGDLLMAIVCVPFSYIPVLKQYWPFGLVLCHVVSPAQAVCVFVSAYTLIALAIDRYMAILYPLRPRLRRSQALVVIALVWVIAVLTSAPIAIFTRLEVDPDLGLPFCEESGWADERLKLYYSLTLMILQYFFPISVLIFTYTRIALAVWGKKAPGEAEDARDQRLAKAKRKTVVMTLCVVVGYTLAWLPLNLFQLYWTTLSSSDPHELDLGSSTNETTNLTSPSLSPPSGEEEQDATLPYIFFASHWLAMAHTAYNPILYGWINAKFRGAFATIFQKCLPTWLRRPPSSFRGMGHFHNTTATSYTTTTLTRSIKTRTVRKTEANGRHRSSVVGTGTGMGSGPIITKISRQPQTSSSSFVNLNYSGSGIRGNINREFGNNGGQLKCIRELTCDEEMGQLL